MPRTSQRMQVSYLLLGEGQGEGIGVNERGSYKGRYGA